MSVTGLVNPNKVITNSGAQVGDCLYLTKPLGTGLITTGIKRDAVTPELIETVVDQMVQLNSKPAEVMLKHHATAATDITGYGLLGHVYEIAVGSGVTIRIFADKLPLLPEVLRLAEEGMIPSGAKANRKFLGDKYLIRNNLDKNLEHVLFDPQTSGGLFIAIGQQSAEEFEKELKSQKIFAPLVGRVEPLGDYSLIIE